MAIDEFGREVPGGPESPHHTEDVDDNDYRYQRRERSSTYDDEDKLMMDPGRRNRSPNRSRSHSAEYEVDKNSGARHRSGSGASGHGGGRSHSPPSHRYNSGFRHRNNPSSPIMRRSRSASRGERRSYSDDWGAVGGRAGFHRGADRNHRARRRFPVDAYVDEPLLCENLWREIYKIKIDQEGDDGPLRPSEIDTSENNKDKTSDHNENTEMQDAEAHNSIDQTPSTEPTQSETKNAESLSEMDVEKSEKSEKHIEETYEKYKNEYCLDYIRSFFNSHLDDEWFKQRYSPFHRKAFAVQMRNRAHAEANSIKEEITKPGDEINPTGAELFVREAKLGIGKKPTGTSGNNTKKRKNRSFSGAGVDGAGNDPHMENDVLFRNPVPSSHILTGHTHCALEITEVPPYVTDAQLSHAVAEHSSSPPLRVCSTTVGFNTSGEGRSSQKYCNSLLRTVWAIFMNEEAKEEMVENLSKANFEANRISDRNRSMDADIIPSIDAPKSQKTHELDIDCSDAFGRTEIDIDGQGGAPPAVPIDPDDIEHANGSKDKSTTIPKVPLRKATVYVQTDSKPDRQNISVLSAALSSRERIPRDKTAALMIARALDSASSIPAGVRLDDIIEILFPNGSGGNEGEEEDLLDVAIAYLRRVHLFSFYNGASSRSEGDVLSGHYPAGTIYLRLRDADSILQKAKEEAAGKTSQQESTDINESNPNDQKLPPTTDLLVQRLDDSISKALDESTAKIERANIMVSENVDADAIQIEKAEIDFKQTWLENHALVDADGRARCSFHFCRKLFKDQKFLVKHLMKKHPEYLAGEQAKIHDSYMMKAWEEEEIRPIPQVVFDCGDRFGLITATVCGICPTVTDPYPELQRIDEEKRARREKEERERRKLFQQRSQAQYDDGPYAPNNRANNGNGQSQRNTGGFVDVDDMQDNKVELSFDNIAIPLPPPKKKKKKKKKIL